MRGTWRRAYQGTGLILRRGMGRTSGWAVAAAAEPVAVLDDVFPRQDRAYNVGSAAAKFVQHHQEAKKWGDLCCWNDANLCLATRFASFTGFALTT
jgi:hypothetical protein